MARKKTKFLKPKKRPRIMLFIYRAVRGKVLKYCTCRILGIMTMTRITLNIQIMKLLK